ncbi:MAG: AAA family ATPase, partial [Erysipelotrichaceae bacterium]|nr:AAA family ATPase [Erysipelotrichaceae bacterium]
MSALTNGNLYIREIIFNWNAEDLDSYVPAISALRNTESVVFNRNITFFVGENGTGKSTLLEAIALACGFNAEGGTINYRFTTYDDYSNLHENIRIIKGEKLRFGYFLRAESFYNVASKEEEYGHARGGIPQDLHYMSHGESFLKFI